MRYKLTLKQALVESHKYHATESIDDVIQGKGKGLVCKPSPGISSVYQQQLLITIQLSFMAHPAQARRSPLRVSVNC